MELLRQFQLRWVVAGFVLTIGIVSCISTRWAVVAKALSHQPIPARHKFFLFFVLNRLLGFLIPKDLADIGGRSLALTRHGVPATASVGSVVLDRLFDVALACQLLPFALLYLSGVTSAVQSLGLMAFSLILVLTAFVTAGGRISEWMLTIVNRAAGFPRLARLKEIVALKDLSLTRLSVALFLRAYLLTVAKHSFSFLRLCSFSAALQEQIPFSIILVVMPVIQLAYMIAITPGSLGIVEGGWVAVLLASGITADNVGGFVLAQRLLPMLYFAILAIPLIILRPWRRAPSR